MTDPVTLKLAIFTAIAAAIAVVSIGTCLWLIAVDVLDSFREEARRGR